MQNLCRHGDIIIPMALNVSLLNYRKLQSRISKEHTCQAVFPLSLHMSCWRMTPSLVTSQQAFYSMGDSMYCLVDIVLAD